MNRGHEVRWLFHSTAMVADYDRAVATLEGLIGLRVLEYSESSEPGIGRRGGMAWAGDNAIEIGEAIVDGGAAQFVSHFGGGMHSLALHVRDLDATIAFLEAKGVRVAARPRPEMCFSDPRDTAGVFLQWSCFELGVDPHLGASRPTPAPGALVPVRRHAFVGAVVDDPHGAATHLATLLDTAVTFDERAAPPGAPAAGVSLGDCTLALFALPAEDSQPLWGRSYHRARTHLLTLEVEDLGTAERTVAEAGIRRVRTDDRLVVLDPAETGGVQLALTDHLLPGDPRPDRLSP